MRKPSKELVAEWYAKLALSGFIDIEADPQMSSGRIRMNDKKRNHTYTQTTFDNARRYYELAAQLWNVRLPRPSRRGGIHWRTKKAIRRRHSEGAMVLEIVHELGVSKGCVIKVIAQFRRQIWEAVRNDKRQEEIQGATQQEIQGATADAGSAGGGLLPRVS